MTSVTSTDDLPPPSLFEHFLEWFMLKFRWTVVCAFLLPLSLANDFYTIIRNYIIFKERSNFPPNCNFKNFQVQSAPRAHDRKVGRIQKEVRDWAEGDKTTRMCTARSGWQTMSFRVPMYKSKMTQIETNTLVDILEVDTKAKTVRCEPMVNMGQLTRHLLPLGYTLPIVPELDDLTVGGMINGCGVESSGRKYGLFQHICVSYEVVLADGSLVTATKNTDNAELQGLFYGIPWSHGTLGLLVAATIRIIPAQPYVKLTYSPVGGFADMAVRLEEESKLNENEFVEGIQFSRAMGVVMTGKFCPEPPRNATVNSIGKWHKQWFYTHVQAIGEGDKEVTEYIPLREYYHRHSKSIFWEIKEIIPFGNNFFFRWLFGWSCPPKISLLKWSTPPPLRRLYDRKHVLQDMLIPLEDLEEGLKVFHDEIEIYPIWLCPFNLPTCPGLVRQKSGQNVLFVDIGAYGVCEKKDYHPVRTTRALEQYVRSVGGVQMLYADTYMSREEFWEMFDNSLYEWLRVKFNAKAAFPDVYDKVNRAVRY